MFLRAPRCKARTSHWHSSCMPSKGLLVRAHRTHRILPAAMLTCPIHRHLALKELVQLMRSSLGSCLQNWEYTCRPGLLRVGRRIRRMLLTLSRHKSCCIRIFHNVLSAAKDLLETRRGGWFCRSWSGESLVPCLILLGESR